VCFLLGVSPEPGLYWPTFRNILSVPSTRQMIWKNQVTTGLLQTHLKHAVQVYSRNNQHYALICTTPLFYILAPTCFGSRLPSSVSFLDPSELQTDGTTTLQHTDHVTTHYMIYHPFDLYFK
jgi:hypothetical protein